MSASLRPGVKGSPRFWPLRTRTHPEGHSLLHHVRTEPPSPRKDTRDGVPIPGILRRWWAWPVLERMFDTQSLGAITENPRGCGQQEEVGGSENTFQGCRFRGEGGGPRGVQRRTGPGSPQGQCTLVARPESAQARVSHARLPSPGSRGGAGTSPRTVALRPGDSAQRSTPWCTVHENTGPCWKQDPDPTACLEARRTQHRKRLALSQASKGSNTALSPDAPLGVQRSPGPRALLGRPEAGSGGSLFVMKYTDAPEKHPSVERRHPSPHHGG